MNGVLSDYQRMFDAFAAMVWVITCDGIILAVNNEVTNITGYSREELIGNSVTLVHPPGVESEIQLILQDITESSEACCHIPLVTKYGKIVEVETRIYKGTWEGEEVLFGFSHDITDSKVIEQKCRIIFHHSPLPILVSTLDVGKIIDVNNSWCDLLGFSRDDVLGKFTSELGIWGGEKRERMHLLEQMAERDVITGVPIKLNKKDGSILYGLFYANKILINGEECWITSLVDKTEEYLLEQELDTIRDIATVAALKKLEKQMSGNKYVKFDN